MSRTDAESCIPDSLYMFLKILYGGQDVLEGEGENYHKYDEDKSDNEIMPGRILSVAQDLVYGVSAGKLWTPKHIRLGCSLHQATRPKQLVQLFHRAGHH